MKTTEISKYILQPNVISRASYSLSTTARRLAAMAMAKLPTDESSFEVSFSIQEFEQSLGIRKSGAQRNYLIEAVRECLDSHIEVFIPQGNGRVVWMGFTWFTESCLHLIIDNIEYPHDYLYFDHFDNKELTDWSKMRFCDKIIMRFNPKFADAIKEFKKAYAKLSLINFGKLQSIYAIRYYEIAMSYNGFAGKEGNPENNWYFEKSLKELRQLFKIEKNKYKVTGNFRTFIIDNPIKELNDAKIGIKIRVDYIREGKYLVGARFNCKFVDDKPKNSAKKAIQSTEMEEKPTKISPEEFAEMKEKYPAEWEKIREEVSQNYYGGWKSAGVAEKSKSGEAIVDEMTFIRLKEEFRL